MTSTQIYSFKEKYACLALIIPIIFIGTALRVSGIFNDLWLDEIWTLWHVHRLNSVGEVFTEFILDNNHILNSLYLFFLGPTDAWHIYRLFALVCAVLALPLFALLAKSRGALEVVLAITFFSFSYFFVLYGSEARGYAPMIFFALASQILCEEFLNTRKPHTLLLLWCTVILGLLSQLTFLMYFFSLMVWFPARLRKDRRFFAGLLETAKLFAVPICVILLLYLIHIRYMPEGSGPLLSYFEVIINTLSVMLGGPELSYLRPGKGAAILISAVLLLGGLCAEIFLRYREGDSTWLFYAYVVLFCPAVFLIVWQPHVVFPRYFAVSILFAYLLLASFIRRAWQKSAVGKVIVMLSVIGFLILNGVYHYAFLRVGRGEYLAALNYISMHSSDSPVVVSGSMDFRDRRIIEFYSRYMMPHREVKYLSSNNAEIPMEAIWYLLQTQDREESPKEILEAPEGKFELKKVFPHAGLSGWTWFLYRREL